MLVFRAARDFFFFLMCRETEHLVYPKFFSVGYTNDENDDNGNNTAEASAANSVTVVSFKERSTALEYLVYVWEGHNFSV